MVTPLYLPQSPSTCLEVENIAHRHSRMVLLGAATDTFLDRHSFNEVILLLQCSTKEHVAHLEEAPWFGASGFLLLAKHFEAEGEPGVPPAELTQLNAGQCVPPRTCISEPLGDAPVWAQCGANPLLDLRPSGLDHGGAQLSLPPGCHASGLLNSAVPGE